MADRRNGIDLMDFSPPPKLWMPSRPAIIRAASLDDFKLASGPMLMAAAGASGLPPINVTLSAQTGLLALGGATYTIFDLVTAVVAGRTVTRLGWYSTSAETAKAKLGTRNSAGNFTIVADTGSVAHPGGGYAYFAISPYVAGANMYVAKCNTVNTANNDATGNISRGFIAGDQTGGPTGGYTENVSQAFPVAYTYQP